MWLVWAREEEVKRRKSETGEDFDTSGTSVLEWIGYSVRNLSKDCCRKEAYPSIPRNAILGLNNNGGAFDRFRNVDW